MRVPVFAFCTLAMLSVGEVRAIALPEMLMAQEFSQTPTEAAPGSQIPYYQDYQPAASSAAPMATPAAASSTAEAMSDASPASSSDRTAQSPDFPSPVLPSTPPAIAPAQTSPPPPVNLLPEDVVVTATNVQVVGVEPNLRQIVLENIQTRPGGATSNTQLQSDIAAILATGLFADANVTSFENPDGLSVVFSVEPIVVRSLQLAGARVLPLTVVNQIFQPQLGQPVDPTALRQAVQQINQWYVENGYTLAQVLALRPSPQGVVTVEVLEGVISDINIRFVNEEGGTVDEDGEPIEGRTREDFIRRELQLQAGQVFNENTARQDLQQLYALGLFENVDISLGGTAQQVDVTYNLAEQLSRSFNVGGGYNDDSGLFGTVTYQDQNFGGVGERINADVQISAEDFQFGTNFTSPYRASNPDRLGYSVDAFRRRTLSRTFTDEVLLPNGDRVREGRFGAGASVSRPLGEWDAELGLNYTRVSLRDGDGEISPRDEEGNPLSFSNTGIDDLTTLEFSMTRDRRNNPVNPSEGNALTLSTEQTIPIGNGSIFGNRLQANYVQYVPVDVLELDEATDRNPEVLAFNLQGGTVLGDLPPYNAFNLGGANSVRGYREGRVGTGRSYVLASAEYRFPVFDPVGAVVFADFASDLGTADEVLGEPGNVRDKPGSGFGFGVGLRVQSPLGLIRADYGINDDGEGRLHFGFGQRF
ncbi:BamA/TamA family outer membrane protein [Leptolyngbya sp. FACHB-671]|uniref:BamA/TamA family outer membrane protein n=1 Tax=Leptolyngbya sp. FACHB-671 TaxID=2692812 RepID=UPI001685080A|nr:BamA/TamA family outer membrane protein [Leptolyngbya sp. FACHB-671]MBD2067088.1 BamA/TamA family outer membrane protein [Leptolyngbya sp. FACHB-671]